MNRTRILLSLVALAILQTAPSLNAQDSRFRANVPFEFSVDNKTMPAGQYYLHRHGVFLYIDAGNVGTYTVVAAGEPSHSGHTSLVFDRVNGSYFLRKIVTPYSDDSVEIFLSRTEKKALAAEHIATLTPTETTTVDLRAAAQ